MLQKLKRLFHCYILFRHENIEATRISAYPLFPIRCSHCGTMYYHTRRKGDYRAES